MELPNPTRAGVPMTNPKSIVFNVTIEVPDANGIIALAR